MLFITRGRASLFLLEELELYSGASLEHRFCLPSRKHLLRTGEGHPGLKSPSPLASVRVWCTVPPQRLPLGDVGLGGASWRNRCQPGEEAWIFPQTLSMCPSSFPTSLQILSEPDSPAGVDKALDRVGATQLPAPHIASICFLVIPHPWLSILSTFHTGGTWLSSCHLFPYSSPVFCVPSFLSPSSKLAHCLLRDPFPPPTGPES